MPRAEAVCGALARSSTALRRKGGVRTVPDPMLGKSEASHGAGPGGSWLTRVGGQIADPQRAHRLPSPLGCRFAPPGELRGIAQAGCSSCARACVAACGLRPGLRAAPRSHVRARVRLCVAGFCDPHPPPVPSDELSRGWGTRGAERNLAGPLGLCPSARWSGFGSRRYQTGRRPQGSDRMFRAISITTEMEFLGVSFGCSVP